MNGASRSICRILDWFHIVMKFRAIDLTASNHPALSALDRRSSCDEMASCKWLARHCKTFKAAARLKLRYIAFDIVTGDLFALGMSLGRLFKYLESNDWYLVNYGRRHYKGLLISSVIAESAVNEVISSRMSKKRHMRWTDEDAHLLAQVRVHVINGDLHPSELTFRLRLPKPVHSYRKDAYQTRIAAYCPALAQSRVKRRAALISQTQALTHTRMAAERAVLLEDKAVPCGPINDVSQAFDDEPVKSYGLAVTLLCSADDYIDSTASIASPLFLKAMPPVLRHAELGFDTVQQVALRATEVV